MALLPIATPHVPINQLSVSGSPEQIDQLFVAGTSEPIGQIYVAETS